MSEQNSKWHEMIYYCDKCAKHYNYPMKEKIKEVCSFCNFTGIINQSLRENIVSKENFNPEIWEGKNKFIKIIKDQFELFKEGENYCLCDYDEIDILKWNVIITICDKLDLILSVDSLHPSDSNVILSVSEKSFLKTLTNNINLEKFLQPFIIEDNDITQKKEDLK